MNRSFKKTDHKQEPKKEYCSPRLVIYGNFKSITTVRGTRGNDGFFSTRVP